ncbi:MAG TPA: rod-binding protein [Gemmatimonadaceae bacterium]|nr:rod-binding protein [Gemmatimonadaceae bacterium]
MSLPSSPVPPPSQSDAERLRRTARDLEGVFVEQLFKAMRETVPQGEGVVDGGSGEAMFTGLLDQRLSAEAPSQWQHGLADALFRQLRGALGSSPEPEAPILETSSPTDAVRPEPT